MPTDSRVWSTGVYPAGQSVPMWPFFLVLISSLLLLLNKVSQFFSSAQSSSPAFLMMYSAYKLNKQVDNIQPWHTPFPICNQSVVSCPVLTVASWPAYRFLHTVHIRYPKNVSLSASLFLSLFIFLHVGILLKHTYTHDFVENPI